MEKQTTNIHAEVQGKIMMLLIKHSDTVVESLGILDMIKHAFIMQSTIDAQKLLMEEHGKNNNNKRN